MHPLLRYLVVPALAGLLAGFVIATYNFSLVSSVILASIATGIVGFAAGGRAGSASL